MAISTYSELLSAVASWLERPICALAPGRYDHVVALPHPEPAASSSGDAPESSAARTSLYGSMPSLPDLSWEDFERASQLV